MGMRWYRVNDRLNLGEQCGNWIPVLNDCSTFVETVIAECRKNPARPGLSAEPIVRQPE